MTVDPSSIPAEVLEVIDVLSAAGHRTVLVGGSVRDLLLKKTPKDFDVATAATPAQVQQRFKRVIPTGIEHGTVTVVVRGHHVEVTTFRAEAEYVDGRRPSKVEFHEDVAADLARRDFTINAMAWDDAHGLVDPFGGQVDLANRTVRCVRSAMERFLEDGLRPLRAVRFATVLDFSLDPDTEAAIAQTLHVFRKVAGERVNQEFAKILASPHAARGVELLARTSLLGAFFPEAVLANAATLATLPVDEAVRLALLLDGVKGVKDIVTRLKFPGKTAEATAALVTHRPLPPATSTDAELRRWVAKVDLSRLEALLAVNQALGLAVEPLAARLRAIAAANPPLTARDLALDGKAIMGVLGVGPSRAVGEATRFLVDQVLEEPSRNSVDALSALLKSWKPLN
jgi:tRNA nucleotidyltransferase (CCA-adding enzyme)